MFCSKIWIATASLECMERKYNPRAEGLVQWNDACGANQIHCIPSYRRGYLQLYNGSIKFPLRESCSGWLRFSRRLWKLCGMSSGGWYIPHEISNIWAVALCEGRQYLGKHSFRGCLVEEAAQQEARSIEGQSVVKQYIFIIKRNLLPIPTEFKVCMWHDCLLPDRDNWNPTQAVYLLKSNYLLSIVQYVVHNSSLNCLMISEEAVSGATTAVANFDAPTALSSDAPNNEIIDDWQEVKVRHSKEKNKIMKYYCWFGSICVDFIAALFAYRNSPNNGHSTINASKLPQSKFNSSSKNPSTR